MKILILGASGFVGRNLAAHLRSEPNCDMYLFDRRNSDADLIRWLSVADVIFHLAGINRPNDLSEYETGNVGFTERVCNGLIGLGRSPKIVFSSSIQAALDNPYGASKRRAEQVLQRFSCRSGAPVRLYRLNNLFGKWCRPNYNSVTATLCNNIANDLPIQVSNPRNEITLSYIDDVVAAFMHDLRGTGDSQFPSEMAIPSRCITLGELTGRIQSFHELRHSLTLADFSDDFNRALYATYVSYLRPELLNHGLEIKSDERGSLAEFIKSKYSGQIFVSRTRPGVTRGNHYHHTKVEKFLVVEGEALIRMRSIEGGSIQEYPVSGEVLQIVDIPPGVTHSIANIGSTEMLTLFWASEIFDPDRPDTYYLPV